MTPKALVQRWSRLFNTRNVRELVSLYGKYSVLMPTFSDKIITNKEEMTKYYETMFTKNVKIRSLEERRTTRTVSNIIHGEYDFVSRSSSNRARYTFVFGVENSDWKIICHHSSVIPGKSSFDPDFYNYLQRCNRYAEMKI